MSFLVSWVGGGGSWMCLWLFDIDTTCFCEFLEESDLESIFHNLLAFNYYCNSGEEKREIVEKPDSDKCLFALWHWQLPEYRPC